MKQTQEVKRYKVQGIYQDIIYAKNEEEAREIFCEMNATCVQAEGDFDKISVEPAPFQ